MTKFPHEIRSCIMWEPFPFILIGMKTPSAGPPPSLIYALSELLRPLVRLLMHYQITFPSFSQIVRRVYLDVAAREFELEDKRQTDSRISLLTGIHRKDVRQFREQPVSPASVPTKPALGAQLVAAWLSLPEYSTEQGEPRPLARLAVMGEPSFESLVALISKKDVRARAVLDEWLRSGMVTIDEGDRVHLQRHAFVATGDLEDKMYFFARSQRDHLNASVANVLGGSPAQFDRNVYYNNLSAESLQQLRNLIDTEAMALLKRVNKKARELQQSDKKHVSAKHRFNFGVFLHSEAQIDSEVQIDEEPKREKP